MRKPVVIASALLLLFSASYYVSASKAPVLSVTCSSQDIDAQPFVDNLQVCRISPSSGVLSVHELDTFGGKPSGEMSKLRGELQINSQEKRIRGQWQGNSLQLDLQLNGSDVWAGNFQTGDGSSVPVVCSMQFVAQCP